MMEGSENIDRFFKEKLENYKENPPQGTWEKIADRLGHNRKRRMVVFISRIAAGISILVSLSVLFHYLQKNENVELAHQVDTITVMKQEMNDNQAAQNPDKQIGIIGNEVSETETEMTEKVPEEMPEYLQLSDNPASKDLDQTSEPEKEDVLHKGSDVEYTASTGIPVSDKISYLKPVICTHINTDESKYDQKMADRDDLKKLQTQKVSIDQLLALTNEKSGEKEKQAKWLVGGQFAPLYSYRSLSSDKYQDYIKSQINSKESGILAFAGGVNLTVTPGRRLSIQSGIFYSKYGQEKNGLEYAALFNTLVSDYNNNAEVLSGDAKSGEGTLSVYIGNSTGKIIAEDESLLNVNQSPWSSMTRGQTESNQLNANMPVKSVTQYFEYLEVPLNLKYKILDKKFDVSLMGGISTNFLIATDIQLNYTDNSSKNTDYTTEGLNRVNYSGLIGIGLEYPLLKNLIFNVEPKFKYYMNPIDTKQLYDIHPYSIGIFSGISYQF